MRRAAGAGGGGCREVRKEESQRFRFRLLRRRACVVPQKMRAERMSMVEAHDLVSLSVNVLATSSFSFASSEYGKKRRRDDLVKDPVVRIA